VPAPKAEPPLNLTKLHSSNDHSIQDALNCLRERFGFAAFRPGQLEVIMRIMDGRSTLAIFPTGAGKSLCFQIPAMLSEGLTLVVSPLIALMREQVARLRSKGVPATHIHSDMSADEVRSTYRALQENAVRILFVAPERFTNEKFRQQLAQLRITLFVIDEAHCLSEWGHSFRPEYLLLPRFARECNANACLALTATATARVAGDICNHFRIHVDDVIRVGVYRPNLTLRCTPIGVEFGSWQSDASDRERLERRVALLADRILSRPRGSTIVYVTLQRTATAVAELLSTKYGLPAAAYHAGMSAEERHLSQDNFMARPDQIIVATIAFGMGIDKREIRYVYHFNLSKSIETYTQGIGRAGRDEKPAICETFLCRDDIPVLESFVLGDAPSTAAAASFLETVFVRREAAVRSDGRSAFPYPAGYERGSLERLHRRQHEVALSIYDLSRDLDMKDTTLRHMLAQLSLRYGYIEEQTGYFGRCEIDLLPGNDVEDTLRTFAIRQSVSNSVLRAARLLLSSVSKPGYRRNAERNMFLRVDIHEAMLNQTEHLSVSDQSGSTTREHLFAAIELLQASGAILGATFSRPYNVFRIIREPDNVERVAADLHQIMLERERHELHRIKAMVALFLGAESRSSGVWVQTRGARCLFRALCAHYNEILVHRCGTCESCRADQSALAETPALQSLRQNVLGDTTFSESVVSIEEDKQWRRVSVELPDLLTDPRLFARFVWGIPSPKISMMRLKFHPLFGCMQGRYPYDAILKAAEKYLDRGTEGRAHLT
jgi:ATP-dependent DNA helicase RecQ